jgi:DNA modification methylase
MCGFSGDASRKHTMQEKRSSTRQLRLFRAEASERRGRVAAMSVAPRNDSTVGFRDAAAADNKQAPVHRWVPWIAGFSAPFVQDVLDHYLPQREAATVLDPFAGVGTTLIETQLRGWTPIGFEINAYAALACRAKLSAHEIDCEIFRETIDDYAANLADLEAQSDDGTLNGNAPRRTAPTGFNTRIPFYSEAVLPKVLLTLDYIESVEDARIADLMRLAFASVMVSFSNYTYEPSLGSRPGAGKPLIENASVSEAVAEKLEAMLEDVAWLTEQGNIANDWAIHERSIMEARDVLASDSVDLVLTSPPYLNNYHYVRNTRPQMYWLGFANSPRDLRKLEETNFGKFWQVVREQDPVAPTFDLPQLLDPIETIRQLRIEKGIYGGGGWANYATTYYNDCNSFLAIMAEVLKPGGAAIIVVGNSVLQGVELKVEEHLGLLGETHGLVVEDIHIVRKKRVGSSIVNTGAREDSGAKTELYDAATVLRRPVRSR